MSPLRALLMSALIALAAAFAATPAQARDIFRHGCLLTSDAPVEFSVARTASGWNCHANLDAVGRYGWVRVKGAVLPQRKAVLIGEAVPVDGIELVVEQRDGSLFRQRIPPSEIASHWTTGTRFEWPLEMRGREIRNLYVRVDRPFSPETVSNLRVESLADADMQRRSTLLLLGAVLGMMILTVFSSLFLAIALRNRAAWYHVGYSAALLVFVCSSGSMLFLAFPEVTLWQRAVISHASLAWAVALIAPFTLEFFERAAMTPFMRKLVILTGILAFAAGFLLPLGAVFGINLRQAFHLAFVPAIIATIVVATLGVMRGSRFASSFVWVWSVPFLFLVERVMRSLGLYELPTLFDFSLYPALTLEAAAMTVALAWRLRSLQNERDEALARQVRLAEEVRLDHLTGLPNRRDYEDWVWEDGHMMALLDLDCFKSINDDYGHAAGDEVLRSVSRVLSEAVAAGTLLAVWRIGGEEFAVALAARNVDAAAVVLNQVRARIPGEVDRDVPGMDQFVTASAGLSPCTGKSATECYNDADRLLYTAKLGGRNQLCWDRPDGAAQPASAAVQDVEQAELQLSRSRKVS